MFQGSLLHCSVLHSMEQVSSLSLSLSPLLLQLHLVDEDELTVFSTLPEKGNFSQDILLCVLSDILHTLPQLVISKLLLQNLD